MRKYEINVINRYGKNKRTITAHSRKEAETIKERLKDNYFDDVQIIIIDKTKYKK